ncbi:MAG: hypothetical protein ACFCUE_07135 [Candidatus Bathyarchaeia archaeon]
MPQKWLNGSVFQAAIVVKENRQSPSDKGYITLGIEANITSNQNLTDYINSRTIALNSLLENTTSIFDAIVTFKAPVSQADFESWGEASVEKYGGFVAIFTDQKTGNQTSSVVYSKPDEEGYIPDLTKWQEGFKFEGVLAVECRLTPYQARNLLSDEKTLLIDPYEDLQTRQIEERYESTGLTAQVERTLTEEVWTHHTQMIIEPQATQKEVP